MYSNHRYHTGSVAGVFIYRHTCNWQKMMSLKKNPFISGLQAVADFSPHVIPDSPHHSKNCLYGGSKIS